LKGRAAYIKAGGVTGATEKRRRLAKVISLAIPTYGEVYS
jgi:hypothetical protein